MSVEFVIGQKYRNRRGEYEILEIINGGRLRVRYTDDNSVAEHDREQQARIITNIENEATAQALAEAKVKPVRVTKSKAKGETVVKDKSATVAVARRATSSSNAKTRQATLNQPVELKSLHPVRERFTKLELLKLVQFVGFGKADGKFWFIGNNEATSDNGNQILSERVATPEFQQEFADAKLYKERYRAETSWFYGNPVWQAANYVVTQILFADLQTEQNRRDYFTEHFGATDGDVLLTDILALPAKNFTNAAQWTYRNSFVEDSPRYNDTLRDPQRFVEDVLLGRAARIKRLNELYKGLKVQKSAPKYIFCYGKNSWKFYREIFPEVKAYTELEVQPDPAKERSLKISLGRDADNGTLIVLLPTLNPHDGATPYLLDRVITTCKALGVDDKAKAEA